MCGRCKVSEASFKATKALKDNSYFDDLDTSLEKEVQENLLFTSQTQQNSQQSPCNNCLPGRSFPIFTSGKKILSAKWGIIPSYTKETDKPNHFRMFNARLENLEKYHKRLINSQRLCIFVCDGFYEWKTEENKKQPYFISNSINSKQLYIGGLYDICSHSSTKICSFGLITLPSSEKMKNLHHRMPVLLSNLEEIRTFLECKTYKDICKTVKSSENISFYPVTPKMNKATYQENDCSTKIELTRVKQKLISNFFISKSTQSKRLKLEKPKK